MVKNKCIILPFLFLAWTIIFAHSIIPHHHHEINHNTECHHCDIDGIAVDSDQEISSCNHDCTDHTCHFHVDVLIKISIDDVFTLITDNSVAFNREILVNKGFTYNQSFISQQLPETKYLRGPPLIS